MQTETPETSWDPGRGGIEHDIMESFKVGKVHPHFMHFGARGKGYRYSVVPSGWKKLYDGMVDVDENVFHRFGMLWEPDGYTLYLDGKACGPKLTDMVSHVPEFVLLTTEVQWYRRGKGAVPEVKAAADAHDDFLVDYVRVYDEEKP